MLIVKALLMRILKCFAIKEVTVTQATPKVGNMHEHTKMHVIGGKIAVLHLRFTDLPTGKTGEPTMATFPSQYSPGSSRYFPWAWVSGSSFMGSNYGFIGTSGTIGCSASVINASGQLMANVVWII